MVGTVRFRISRFRDNSLIWALFSYRIYSCFHFLTTLCPNYWFQGTLEFFALQSCKFRNVERGTNLCSEKSYLKIIKVHFFGTADNNGCLWPGCCPIRFFRFSIQFFGGIQSKSITNVWLAIQIHFSKWIVNPIQLF